jgi:hypothetical protein
VIAQHSLPDFPALATPLGAKRVWDSQRFPSARSVAKALSEAGRPVHFTTVARWRREGWRMVMSPEHSIERARRALSTASSVLTGDPNITIEDWVPREGRSEELTRIDDDQLLARMVRETSILSILLMEESARRRDLISDKPKQIAAALEAAAAAVRACAEATSQVKRLRGASIEEAWTLWTTKAGIESWWAQKGSMSPSPRSTCGPAAIWSI